MWMETFPWYIQPSPAEDAIYQNQLLSLSDSIDLMSDLSCKHVICGVELGARLVYIWKYWYMYGHTCFPCSLYRELSQSFKWYENQFVHLYHNTAQDTKLEVRILLHNVAVAFRD